MEIRVAVLFAVLALVSCKAFGADNVMVARDGENSVTLHAEACTDAKVLPQIRPQHRARFQRGEAAIDGQKFGLCWIALPDGNVLLIYSDGDTGQLPLSYFKRETGT